MNQIYTIFYNSTTLCDILKGYRNEKKLTQEQLAELLDVSIRTISHWECGRIPNHKHFEKILQLEDMEKFITHQQRR